MEKVESKYHKEKIKLKSDLPKQKKRIRQFDPLLRSLAVGKTQSILLPKKICC